MLIAYVYAVVTAPYCCAQTNDEINAGLQFNFFRPGARSLSLGNAFVGLDYDATFAFTNPAGLWLAPEPSISVEVRHASYATRYIDGGSGSGSPSMIGLDQHLSLIFGDYKAQTQGVSFFSFVYPTEFASIAVFRHELANYAIDIDGSQGAFLGPSHARGRVAGVRGELSLHIPGTGSAVSFRLGRQFWLGFGLVLYEMDLQAITRRYDVRTDGGAGIDFGAIEFPVGGEASRHLQSGHDYDWTGTIGLIWESPHRKWSVGAAFREGPRFDMNYGVEFNDDEHDPRKLPHLAGATSFEVPSVFSFGVAAKPISVLLISLEYAWVGYSVLEPEANILPVLVVPGGSGEFVTLQEDLARFEVPDGQELHAGVEYQLQRRNQQIDVRLGAWYDPDHQMRYTGGKDNLASRFVPGEGEVHLTAGFGVLRRKSGASMDLGVDYSSRGYILSATYGKRFSRPWQ